MLGWAVSVVARNDSNIFADYELWQIVSGQPTHAAAQAGAVAKPHSSFHFSPRVPPHHDHQTMNHHPLPAAVRCRLDLIVDCIRNSLNRDDAPRGTLIGPRLAGAC